LTLLNSDYRQQAQRLVCLALILLVSACVSNPQSSNELVSPADIAKAKLIAGLAGQAQINKPIVPVSPTTIEVDLQNDAVTALLDSAKVALLQGDLKSAQTLLQRVQRIAPRDPNVYYKLASTHLDLKDYKLAENVALKGVSLAQGQDFQLRKFWLMIANIRMQSGDIIAAEKAEHTASRY